jgi:GNAT superfamily N-acetyltransferase
MPWYRLVMSGGTSVEILYEVRSVPKRRRWTSRWPRELQRLRHALPRNLRSIPPAWPDSWLLVAHHNAKPVAFAWVEDLEDWVCVQEVAVLPPYQGQGIATSLLTEVRRRLHAERGARPCREVRILPINRGSGWVERAGFRESGGDYAVSC